MCYLGTNGDKLLEKTIVLLCQANIASTLVHPDILQAKQHNTLILVQQPDQASLVGDEESGGEEKGVDVQS